MPVSPIRYDPLVQLIDSRAPACGSTTVIAVDGPSGAGKTDFCGGLAAALGAPVLHFDDIYPGWSGLTATPQMIVDGVLSPLSIGETGSIARWDWDHQQPSETIHFTPTPLLILDGVGSGARVCRPFLSLLIWLDAPASTRKRRALTRDGGAYEPFWDMWSVQERELFASDDIRGNADVVVDTGGDGILDPIRTDRTSRGASNG